MATMTWLSTCLTLYALPVQMCTVYGILFTSAPAHWLFCSPALLVFNLCTLCLLCLYSILYPILYCTLLWTCCIVSSRRPPGLSTLSYSTQDLFTAFVIVEKEIQWIFSSDKDLAWMPCHPKYHHTTSKHSCQPASQTAFPSHAISLLPQTTPSRSILQTLLSAQLRIHSRNWEIDMSCSSCLQTSILHYLCIVFPFLSH